MKRFYILAGANGSGKSTVSKVLLPSEGIVYVNPDDIAKELNPQDPPAAKVDAGRIRIRVQNGGHDVPPEDVIRRYARSKQNFLSVYAPLADHWMLYYNGGAELSFVAHGNGSVSVIMRDLYASFTEGLCLR